MPLTNAERAKLVTAIKNEAIKLYQYRGELRDTNSIRQQAIDNDLGMIHQRLRELITHTGVDAAWLNNT